MWRLVRFLALQMPGIGQRIGLFLHVEGEFGRLVQRVLQHALNPHRADLFQHSLAVLPSHSFFYHRASHFLQSTYLFLETKESSSNKGERASYAFFAESAHPVPCLIHRETFLAVFVTRGRMYRKDTVLTCMRTLSKTNPQTWDDTSSRF
jgi:hypothetical protein